ncbi:unnamed protein product [Didymodactylos carnosus]|uniref:Uncharacterized protein n=1 Tax=Didymodactylos carnosus TaxID=1234261 RepID=A0A8S2HVI4_9BILA|nr:unnamed protein product [Didymodactylos carnosus]CAF3689328.1 unnamed protein product [Didymodactylos carnosus]
MTTTTMPAINSCPVNEVLYENHCYYLDGSGGNCLVGYSRASEIILSKIAREFIDKDYKTTISDNCCIWTRDEYQNYGMPVGFCSQPGPFRHEPVKHGSNCKSATNNERKQLTFCGSD